MKQRSRGHWARPFLCRHEHAGPLLVLAGIVWDALTLQRIDGPLDLLILGMYLVRPGAS
ncbi:MAG: hypothetical protein ABEL97_02525 [Salinibacter sp.]